MPKELQDEVRRFRWAGILAQASVMGGAAACRAYRVSERSLRNWWRTVETDPAFRDLYEQKRREYEEAWAGHLRARRLPARSPAADSTRSLARAIAVSISVVAVHCGLPPVTAILSPRVLPPEQHPDLLLGHGAAGYTGCLVLKHRAARRHAREHRVVGRLLFMLEDARLMISAEDERLTYLENIRLLCRLTPACVRPVVLGDYDPGPVFRRALARYGASFFDVSACLRNQNVLAPERRSPSPSEVAAA